MFGNSRARAQRPSQALKHPQALEHPLIRRPLQNFEPPQAQRPYEGPIIEFAEFAKYCPADAEGLAILVHNDELMSQWFYWFAHCLADIIAYTLLNFRDYRRVIRIRNGLRIALENESMFELTEAYRRYAVMQRDERRRVRFHHESSDNAARTIEDIAAYYRQVKNDQDNAAIHVYAG